MSESESMSECVSEAAYRDSTHLKKAKISSKEVRELCMEARDRTDGLRKVVVGYRVVPKLKTKIIEQNLFGADESFPIL